MRPPATAHLGTLSVCQAKPAWGITGLRPTAFPARLGSSESPIVNLPFIGLLCALVCFVCLIPVWFACGMTNSSITGLWAFVAHRGVPASTLTPGLTAPLVEIDAKGRVFLNYKQTTWEELPAVLDRALVDIPVRVVYVDGDSAATFMDVVRAVDIAQGLGVKTILLTPDSKEELWKRSETRSKTRSEYHTLKK
jgi:hypothetical protein